MKRLNLGAGTDVRPREEGWTNTDVRGLPGIDVVCDARGPLPFEDGSFDEILAQDLLEHLPQEDVLRALLEWRRILIPGGVLRIRVPNLPKIFTKALSGRLLLAEAVTLIYGDQSESAGGTEFGSHKTGWDAASLKSLLESAGFADVKVEVHPEEFNLYGETKKP